MGGVNRGNKPISDALRQLSRKGKLMDIERDGVVVKNVIDLGVDEGMRKQYGWRYGRMNMDGSSTFYNQSWQPVNEWMTIEVKKKYFDEYIAKMGWLFCGKVEVDSGSFITECRNDYSVAIPWRLFDRTAQRP